MHKNEKRQKNMALVSKWHVKRHPELVDALRHLQPGTCLKMPNGTQYLLCEPLDEPLDSCPCLCCSLRELPESFCLGRQFCFAHKRPDGVSVRFLLLNV